jgi:hypothetical protein
LRGRDSLVLELQLRDVEQRRLGTEPSEQINVKYLAHYINSNSNLDIITLKNNSITVRTTWLLYCALACSKWKVE